MLSRVSNGPPALAEFDSISAYVTEHHARAQLSVRTLIIVTIFFYLLLILEPRIDPVENVFLLNLNESFVFSDTS